MRPSQAPAVDPPALTSSDRSSSSAGSSKSSKRPSEVTSEEDSRGSLLSGSLLPGRVLINSSRPTWTGTPSAAALAMRYIEPMRIVAEAWLPTPKDADEAVTALLQHFVNAGFGKQDHGRLRDYLLRGVRSAGKLRLAAQRDVAPRVPTDQVKIDWDVWVSTWREGLMRRAWRQLERRQHAVRQSKPEVNDRTAPILHDALWTATRHAGQSAEWIADRVAARSQTSVSADDIRSAIASARVRLAQAVADEVAETLDQPDPAAIGQEIRDLGLSKIFNGVRVQKAKAVPA